MFCEETYCGEGIFLWLTMFSDEGCCSEIFLKSPHRLEIVCGVDYSFISIMTDGQHCECSHYLCLYAKRNSWFVCIYDFMRTYVLVQCGIVCLVLVLFV